MFDRLHVADRIEDYTDVTTRAAGGIIQPGEL